VNRGQRIRHSTSARSFLFSRLTVYSLPPMRVGRLLFFLGILCLAGIIPVRSQSVSDSASRANPYVPEQPVSLPSPDNVWTLRSGCDACSTGRALWLVSNGDHHRRLVRRYDGTLRVGWSPDGDKFFVNEEEAGDKASAYVVDPSSLKMTELGKLIAAGDPESAKYLEATHSHVSARAWLDSNALLVNVTGHLDQPPLDQFEVQFQVHLDGAVTRLSIRQWPLFSAPPPSGK
jgi:hypothetical protein